jgi:hypothetical protein
VRAIIACAVRLGGYGDSEWMVGYYSIVQLFRQGETLHADHRSVRFLGFRVGEAQVGCTKNMSFPKQTSVVVQRRVLLGGYQHALRTVGRKDPDLVQQNLGHVDVAFSV